MGSMFQRHILKNEIHTHGRTMGHEITAMEKKKIQWKTNQDETCTWSKRLLIPLDVIPCWGSHLFPLSSFKNSTVGHQWQILHAKLMVNKMGLKPIEETNTKMERKGWIGVVRSAKRRISISFGIATMENTLPLIRLKVAWRNSQEFSQNQILFPKMTKVSYKVEEGSLYTRGFLVLETKRLVVQVRETCNTSYKLVRVS